MVTVFFHRVSQLQQPLTEVFSTPGVVLWEKRIKGKASLFYLALLQDHLAVSLKVDVIGRVSVLILVCI